MTSWCYSYQNTLRQCNLCFIHLGVWRAFWYSSHHDVIVRIHDEVKYVRFIYDVTAFISLLYLVSVIYIARRCFIIGRIVFSDLFLEKNNTLIQSNDFCIKSRTIILQSNKDLWQNSEFCDKKVWRRRWLFLTNMEAFNMLGPESTSPSLCHKLGPKLTKCWLRKPFLCDVYGTQTCTDGRNAIMLMLQAEGTIYLFVLLYG